MARDLSRLGALLKGRRTLIGKTQVDAAGQLEDLERHFEPMVRVHATRIKQWETGRTRPRNRLTLFRYCREVLRMDLLDTNTALDAAGFEAAVDDQGTPRPSVGLGSSSGGRRPLGGAALPEPPAVINAGVAGGAESNLLQVRGRMLPYERLANLTTGEWEIQTAFNTTAPTLPVAVQRRRAEEVRRYIDDRRAGKPVHIGRSYGVESFDVVERGPIEKSVLRLRFRPADWITLRATNLSVDKRIMVEGRETSLRRLFAERVNLTTSPVPEFANYLLVSLLAITEDDPPFAILTRRNERLDPDGGLFACSVAENPKRVPRRPLAGDVDSAWRGERPDPYVTALRGVEKELGLRVSRDKVRFLEMGVDHTRCQPVLIGVVRVPGVEEVRASLPGSPESGESAGGRYLVPWTPSDIANFVQGHGPWSVPSLATIMAALQADPHLDRTSVENTRLAVRIADDEGRGVEAGPSAVTVAAKPTAEALELQTPEDPRFTVGSVVELVPHPFVDEPGGLDDAGWPPTAVQWAPHSGPWVGGELDPRIRQLPVPSGRNLVKWSLVETPRVLEDDLAMTLQVRPTDWATVRRTVRAVRERPDLLRELGSCDLGRSLLPHCLCLHFVVRLRDGELLCAKRSRDVNDYGSIWTFSGEEQVGEEDVTGPRAEGLTPLFQRALRREVLSVPGSRLSKVIRSWRLWSVFIETDRLFNVALLGVYQLSLDRDELRASIIDARRQGHVADDDERERKQWWVTTETEAVSLLESGSCQVTNLLNGGMHATVCETELHPTVRYRLYRLLRRTDRVAMA